MKVKQPGRTTTRALSLFLATLAIPGAALAQGLATFHEIHDNDWNYWSNSRALFPTELADWVGIGTSQPASNLEINQRNNDGGLRLAWGDTYPNLFAEIGYPEVGGGLIINSRANGGWADIDMMTDGVSRLFIESQGNIGMGTHSPQASLEIFDAQATLRLSSDSLQGSVLELKSTPTTAGTWRGRIQFLDQADATKAEIFYYDLPYFDNPGMGFQTDASTRMFINKTTGNIGIGTDSPLGSLSTYSRTLEIQGDAPSIVLDDVAGGVTDDFEIANDGGTVYFRDATDGVNVMALGLHGGVAGRVGIMTSSPQGTLDVNGSIYQRGGVLHADYVFEDDYELESIEEHAAFMWENKHLTAIPKARADENGLEVIEVGSHRRGIVEELEKAHIYIDQLHRRIAELDARLAALEAGDAASE